MENLAGFFNRDGLQYNLGMRVYLDICCLKRPFDDQSQPRIHLEAEAVLALLDASAKQIEFLHAAAHDLENEQNSLPSRAAKVREWLQRIPLADLADEVLQVRTGELMALGFRTLMRFTWQAPKQGASRCLPLVTIAY